MINIRVNVRVIANCVCTCSDGSFVESHTYNRSLARELAATWTAVCPAVP